MPGLLLKAGAEGVEGFALADGRAAAFKIDDGAQRGAAADHRRAAARARRWRGPGADTAVLDRLARPPVLGGGRPVGEIRVLLPS